MAPVLIATEMARQCGSRREDEDLIVARRELGMDDDMKSVRTAVSAVADVIISAFVVTHSVVITVIVAGELSPVTRLARSLRLAG
jgi:hypothetical protein